MSSAPESGLAQLRTTVTNLNRPHLIQLERWERVVEKLLRVKIERWETVVHKLLYVWWERKIAFVALAKRRRAAAHAEWLRQLQIRARRDGEYARAAAAKLEAKRIARQMARNR